jgi:hypothetical protein
VGWLQIRSKRNGLDFGAYFLLGFNSLGIIVSNSTHSPPPAIEIGALGGALRMIPSTLPRFVNRVAGNEQTERLQMRVSKEFLKLVDAWRRKQEDLPGRSEAIAALQQRR